MGSIKIIAGLNIICAIVTFMLVIILGWSFALVGGGFLLNGIVLFSIDQAVHRMDKFSGAAKMMISMSQALDRVDKQTGGNDNPFITRSDVDEMIKSAIDSFTFATKDDLQSGIKSQMKIIESQQQKVNTQLKDFTIMLDSFATKEDISSEATAMKSKVGFLKKEIVALQDAKQDLQNKIAGIENFATKDDLLKKGKDYKALQQSVTNLQKEIGVFETFAKKDDIEDQVKSIKKVKTNMKAELQSEIKTLSQTKETLHKEIKTLQNFAKKMGDLVGCIFDMENVQT